jgi:putative ABC transport system permease protein
MRTFSIALRNLVRNARRSLATLLGISIGAVAVLLFGGYRANIDYSMQTAYVRLGGHLQIQHKDYFLYGSGNPTAYGVLHYRRIIDGILQDPTLAPMVDVVTPTLQFGGIAGNYAADVSRTVIGNGIVADDQARLRVWNQYDLRSDIPPFRLSKSAGNAAIVGVGLARGLQLCDALVISDCPRPEQSRVASQTSMPSDLEALSMQEAKLASGSGKSASASDMPGKIDLLASNPRGAPNVVALNVIGAESQGFKEFDEVSVVMHLHQAQRLVFGAAEPKATSIVVQLRDTRLTPQAQSLISERLAAWSGQQPLVVRDFRFLNPFYVQSINMFGTIFGFMFLLIGGIVMFTVSNTMNTTVVERTVEIGTLRAMGVRQAGIRRLFVAEGCALGVAGSLMGLALALFFAMVVNLLDLHWLPPGSATPVPLTLSLWGEWGLILGTTGGLIVMATVSAWWPAYRAARLNVVEALRHV